MPTAEPSVRPVAGPRRVLVRPDVGAAGHIIQRSDLTTRRAVVDRATLILVEEGRKRVRGASGEVTAGPGEAVAIQPGEVVDIANTPGPRGSYRALWICWADELLGEPPRRASPRLAAHTRLAGEFLAAFQRAFDGLRGDLPASVAVHRLREVLLWLGERRFQFTPPPPPSLEQRVRRLLAADPAATWPMELVARETATSVPTLRRRLAAEGAAFRDILLDVRMAHALALLQNTDEPVLSVALAAGYTSPSRFTARFRARFGHLPTEIRRRRRRT